jgi:hypothetical protein
VPQDSLTAIPVLIDLNNMPGNDSAVLFRVILRALYEAYDQIAEFDRSLAQVAEDLYRRVQEKTDPFVSQSAVREVLFAFRDRGVRLTFILDPFGTFWRSADVAILDSVRGLRDSFRGTLSYIVGLRQELDVLRDPTDMGELYDVLDMHSCYVGAMETDDAYWVVRQVEEAAGHSFSKAQTERLVELSGAYPSLLRATSLWLTRNPSFPPEADWLECLLAERSVQHRMEELWTSLADEDRRMLCRIPSLLPDGQLVYERTSGALGQMGEALCRLSALGLCEPAGGGWHVRGDLLAMYVSREAALTVDEIRLDEVTGEPCMGQSVLMDLTPLERDALVYLIKHPHVHHTMTDLILNAWPDDPYPLERTDDSVYQVIRGLRRKIEPNPCKPRYIITRRGVGARKGGYQFFPQGR